MPNVPTKKIQFNVHTPVDANKIPPQHCGRLQRRPIPHQPGDDPNVQKGDEWYFPAGTVLEIHDFISQGHADEVHPDTVPASPTPAGAPELAPRLRKVKSIDITNQPTDGSTANPDDAAASSQTAITAAQTNA